MVIALAVLAAIIVFSGYLLFDMAAADKKRKSSLRARIAPDGSSFDDQQYEDRITNLNGEPSQQAAGMLRLLKAMGVNTHTAIAKLNLRFARAGVRSPDAPIYYLMFQRVGSLVMLALALLFFVRANADNKMMMYTASVFTLVLGLFGPQLYLQNMIDKRKKVLQRAFPDTLDLLLICVESGLALDAALARVCSELGRAYPEMTGELNRTRLELSLLNDRVRALTNLGERTDMTAFRSLVTALVQSERFGTSLTDTLRVLSEDFRLERLTIAEAKAARLPVLMTIPLICLLMPAFFLIVLGPAIVSILKDTSGM